MDEYFASTVNETIDEAKEETMEEKTFFGKAFDFVKNHKLEIAAGIGLAYLGYKFGSKKAYNLGFTAGKIVGDNSKQDEWMNFIYEVFPKEDTAYEVVRQTIQCNGNERIGLCASEITPATIAELKALVKDLDLK